MNIFLTGATGFLGKIFLKKALEKKYFIYAVTRKNKTKKDQRKNLKWLVGNIDDDWSHQLAKCDVLVHLAAAGVKKKGISFDDAYNNNVTKPLKLLLNADKNNCKKWIIAGSSSEYGESLKENKLTTFKTTIIPTDNYSLTKSFFSKISFELSNKLNIKCRLMRIFPVYGQGEYVKRFYPSLIQAAKRGSDFYINNPNLLRDFSDVDDVAEKLIQAVNFNINNKKVPQIWHLASGNPVRLKDFAMKIWKQYQASGQLLGSNTSKDKYFHISNKNEIWKYIK